jgi:flagellar biosynthetic protein FliS
MTINQQSTFMTDNNPYKNASSAYGSMQQANISGFEVVSELYKGMIRFVGLAKSSYESGRLDDMCMYIEKTNKILMALQSHLDFEQGGEASVFLNDFYNGIFMKLFKVLRTSDPAASFDEIYEILKPVSKIWESHAENVKKASPDVHVPMPEMPEIIKQ